jgi:carboxypeptidase PM20D1
MDYTAKKEDIYYAKGLSRLVQVPTVSGSCDAVFEAFRAVLKEQFPHVFKAFPPVIVHGNTLLFHCKGASDKKPIVLMAHQDVVPSGDNSSWKYPAFSGMVAENKVYGRGTADCKCTLYTEIQAMEELIAEGIPLPHDVYLAFSDGEEVSGPGACKTVEYLRERGVKPYIVLDEGGAIMKEVFKGQKTPCCVIGIYEKGYADVRFAARSAGGHSSMPPRRTPFARLAAFMNDVEKHRYFKYHMDKETMEMFRAFAPALPQPFKRIVEHIRFFKPLMMAVLTATPFGRAILATTVTFTMAKGSDAPNVIPEEAYVIANMRFSRHQGMEESLAIMKRIAEKYDVTIAEVRDGRDASPVVDIDGEGFRYVADCAKKLFPQYGVAPAVLMGGTDCRHFQEICGNAMRFCPMVFDPQQIAAMHASNENIDVIALRDAVSFYKYLVLNNQ